MSTLQLTNIDAIHALRHEALRASTSGVVCTHTETYLVMLGLLEKAYHIPGISKYIGTLKVDFDDSKTT